MKWIALIMAMLIAGVAWLRVEAQEVEYCFDRTTYPPKVVVIPAGTQCPPGYYR